MAKLIKIMKKTTIFYTNITLAANLGMDRYDQPFANYLVEEEELVLFQNETNTEYKNFDKLDTRRRLNIIFLCTDLTDRPKSKHIVDAAWALNACGHKITIVTCAYLANVHDQDLSQIKVIEIGQWIPRDIFGYFQPTFYLLRSIYSALWSGVSFRNTGHKPTVMFCETNYMAIPILKSLSKFKIIYFQYKFDMALQHQPIPDVKFEHTWFLKSSLESADQILVPNGTFYEIYHRYCGSRKVQLVVCQPYIDVRQLKMERTVPVEHVLESTRDCGYIYLVLGEYHKRSNFELIIEAFHMLLLNVKHEQHNQMHLVFSGHCSRNNGQHTQYYRYLQKKVHDHHLLDRISFTRRLEKCHKKSLMVNAIAILDPTIDELFSRYLLEAMALRRPIIATDTGFAKEVLKHSVTAYLVPPTAEHFSVAMADVLLNKQKGDCISKRAYREFHSIYSFEAYGMRLNDLVYNDSGRGGRNVKILAKT